MKEKNSSKIKSNSNLLQFENKLEHRRVNIVEAKNEEKTTMIKERTRGAEELEGKRLAIVSLARI